ncbi:sigma factor [Methylobacterium sp. WSM2598]|uniref:sigma factor n=1 Tax=Methylobacterium sp. WSM2598 TaxID=398261 RepID=UPI0003749608|nr:sigma factor [Methylobacterium sp. WSM2598]
MDARVRFNEIHARLLAGSRTASAEMFREGLGPIKAFLASEFPTLADEDLNDLATDAIVAYVGDPERCDLGKGSLWTYLCNVAKRDAIDLIRLRTRRDRLLQEKVETDVEFWASRAKDTFRGDDAIDARKIMRLHGGRLVKNDAEARVLVLILKDEDRTEAFAEALGIDPKAADTEKIVKRVKDRIDKRLQRCRDEL